MKYTDFNRGDLTYTHSSTAVGREGRLECTGICDYGDEPPFEGGFYEFAGPHRSAPHEPIMCRGSGAERTFLAK